MTDMYGRTDTATVRISVIVNCSRSTRSNEMISTATVTPIITQNTRRSLPLERQKSLLGDFILRVACGTPPDTVIGTLNPTALVRWRRKGNESTRLVLLNHSWILSSCLWSIPCRICGWKIRKTSISLPTVTFGRPSKCREAARVYGLTCWVMGRRLGWGPFGAT